MKKIRVMTVLGTRPEIIRLSRTIEKLDKYTDHTLVHTGQNYDYELNEIFFEDLNVRKPNYFLNAAGKNASETIGNILIKIEAVFEDIDPEALLILGDTNSSLVVIAAKRRKIPIFHMEAGNRCFDQRVPEEINRKIVDHTSDINLTYSSIAREHLIKEGIPSNLIIKTGSPMKEVILHNMEKINSSKVLKIFDISQGCFFVVSFHREENIDSDVNFKKFVVLLNHIAKLYKLPILLSAHPRTKKKINELNMSFDSNIKILKPLSYSDYVKLQISAKAVLSDSGTISEESSILDFPALNLREAHERPESMEESSVMMAGLDLNRVVQTLDILKEQNKSNVRLLKEVEDYDIANVSEKIVRIIHSYIDYINNVIWKKNI